MPKSKNLTWLDVAEVFTASARMITRFTNWSNNLFNGTQNAQQAQTYALNAQRLENLRIEAQIKTQRAAEVSNKVVMTDARAELDREKLLQQIQTLQLKNLELRKKLEAAGAFNPNFTADGYAEPGDVRRGRMYETNTPDGS